MPRPTLYFIRHGETDWNGEHRLQGQHDIPLNARGRVQAARSGEVLRDLLEREGKAAADTPTYPSPLGRARETMELMRAAMGLEPLAYRTDARLMEMSFGRWEGFTFAELQARESEALAERERDKWGFVLPGGESYAQLQVRVRSWCDGIEQDTVVSAHGGVCRVLMASLNFVEPMSASVGNVGQGCVYVFNDNGMGRYE